MVKYLCKRWLILIVLVTFLIGVKMANAEVISPSTERICNGNICTMTLYSAPMYAKNSEGKWVNASDVFYVTRKEDDITFHYDGEDGYYNITFEAGVLYNGVYHSFHDVIQTHPELSISFPTEKHKSYWKYAVNISNIPDAVSPNIDSVTLTYKNHYGFKITDLKGAKKRFIIKKMGLYFNDLLEKYTVTLDLPNRRILIGNITSNIENGSLYLDPTVQLQDADSEVLEDGYINHQESTNIHAALIKFNISAIPSGMKITNATLGVYYYLYDGDTLNYTYLQNLHNQTWTEDDILKDMAELEYAGVSNKITYYTPGVDKYWTFEVTDLVNYDYNLGNSNTTILLSMPNRYNQNVTNETNVLDVLNETMFSFLILGEGVRAYSKEASNESLRPYLNITYTYVSKWSNNQSSTPTYYTPSTNSEFNITWVVGSGDISTVLLESNYTGTSTNYTMSNSTYGGSIYTYSNILPSGSFYWKSYANDTVENNWNTTDIWYFTIQKNQSNPVHLVMSKDNWVTNYTDSNISVNTADNVGVDCYLDYTNSGDCSLYINGALVSHPYYNTYGKGTFTVITNTTGNANYTSNMTGVTKYIISTVPEGIGDTGGGGSGGIEVITKTVEVEKQDIPPIDISNITVAQISLLVIGGGLFVMFYNWYDVRKRKKIYKKYFS